MTYVGSFTKPTFNFATSPRGIAMSKKPMTQIRVEKILSRSESFTICSLQDRTLMIPHSVSPGLPAIAKTETNFNLHVQTKFLLQSGVLKLGRTPKL